MKARGRFQTAIAFHAQQAVEKYLKAMLVAHRVDFPKTHDIARILDLLATVESALASSLRDAELLTPFAADVRYPGDLPELLEGEERELFEIAQRVRDTVSPVLESYLRG